MVDTSGMKACCKPSGPSWPCKAARSESARHSVLQLLQALCGVAGSGPAPRGYGGLLELLLELSLDLQQPLPAATAAALATLEIGGKGAAARARLVALAAGHKAP